MYARVFACALRMPAWQAEHAYHTHTPTRTKVITLLTHSLLLLYHTYKHMNICIRILSANICLLSQTLSKYRNSRAQMKRRGEMNSTIFMLVIYARMTTMRIVSTYTGMGVYVFRCLRVSLVNVQNFYGFYVQLMVRGASLSAVCCWLKSWQELVLP